MYKNCQKTTFSIAFTLVELLVVISIIGLLAGLAIPAINGGLKSAKAGACLSNLHQIGVATMAYAADNSFKLPPGGSDGENNWARDVYNYCGGADSRESKKTLFICPGSLKPVKTDVVVGQIPLTYSGHKGLMPSASNAVVALSSVARPTEVILAGDGCQVAAGGYAGYVIDSPSIFSMQTGKGGGWLHGDANPNLTRLGFWIPRRAEISPCGQSKCGHVRRSRGGDREGEGSD